MLIILMYLKRTLFTAIKNVADNKKRHNWIRRVKKSRKKTKKKLRELRTPPLSTLHRQQKHIIIMANQTT